MEKTKQLIWISQRWFEISTSNFHQLLNSIGTCFEQNLKALGASNLDFLPKPFKTSNGRGKPILKFFLENCRFYKTKYLVNSFYIFLCPLAELVTLSSSMSLPYTCQEILSFFENDKEIVQCPVNGQCMTSNVVYSAEIKSRYSTKSYIGMIGRPFIERWKEHRDIM